ncbi:hypothetical protein [Chryseobacterium pennipullorum]|uniref:Uncharacterized protein n=1 Tax=Chryseobacterium pennipullorum TaxID=2258963 RepID=A0A3D9AYP5_9FLAO|nr:hypothetical protein [Chryseobacterium pennipullorum]REC46441.1 hypothetical protein DRF67_14280 [Chryseobacterium pennipullorum]
MAVFFYDQNDQSIFNFIFAAMIMVNKGALRKLSNVELEKYLKEDSGFIPEAVQMAFEILEERGRYFTAQEKTAVQQFIERKKEAEESKSREEKELWKDHVTEDPNAIKLYSRTTIFISSILFSTIPAAILLSLNLIKLKKYFAAVLTLMYGFLFFVLQKYVLLSHFEIGSSPRYSPEIGVIGAGALGFIVLWVLAIPEKLPYRQKPYVLPIILCAGTVVLMYFYFPEWFSHYPFVRSMHLLRQ